jgi:hypothetical protein
MKPAESAGPGILLEPEELASLLFSEHARFGGEQRLVSSQLLHVAGGITTPIDPKIKASSRYNSETYRRKL